MCLKKLILNELLTIYQKINEDKCEISEEEFLDIIHFIGHLRLNKTQACDELNMSRSKFDKLVSLGKLPQGKKFRGENTLVWYKDELLLAIKKLKDE